MNGDTGDAPALTPPTTATTTPVRRSARARKPNSRFADDEVDSCFKKIVSGLASPEATPAPASISTTVPAPATAPALSLSRPRKAVGRRKDSRSEERSEEVEGRGERGRKDSKEDERSEELEERSDRGRKLSEGSEEKSERKRKEKSEELEERSEQGKKVRQNEQQTEDLEEKREKRRKTSETEERDDKRRRKDSQSDSSGEKREKPIQPEGKSVSHSLPNGLEAEEEGDECFRVTRSGRREEDPRRKIRKRGKGKEEEEQEGKEVVAEDDRATAEPVTHERSEAIQGASCTPAVLPTSVRDSENGDSDREGIGGPRKGDCLSPTHTDGGVVETSTGVEGRVCQSGGRDTASLKDAEHILPCQEKDKVEGNSATQEEVRQRGEGVCVTATTKPATACKTNGDTDGGSLYTTQSGDTTTSTTTTAPATATTAATTITTATVTPSVITATTTITVVTTTTVASTSATTIAAISSPTTTTTTSYPKQTPQEPAPPQAPSEVPTDPRFHRGACDIPVELVGSIVPPQTQGTINLGAIPSPSRPPPPPDTPTGGKEGVVPAQGSRQNSRDSGRECQGSVGTVPVLKTVKLLCEDIPLPQTPSPSSFSSPKHNNQGEEALSKAGGKRERRGKEESTRRPWKAEEQEELCSPESKRRKHRDGEKREEVEEREESKDDETKRKRATDTKEEDKRKRRKVEEAEEKESKLKISPRETPLPFSLADIKVPPPPAPLSAPASSPPLPPSPRKLTTAPQNSPRSKREFLTSPRAEKESHKEKDSPRQNWESHRSESATLVQEKELPRDFKDGKDTGKGSKDSPSSSKDSKGGRETVRSEREVSKDSKDFKSGRETVRSEKEVSKDSKDFKGGKDALKCEKEPLKDQIHLSRCEVDPGKGERAKDEEGGCQKGCEGDLGRGRLLECARNTGRSREDSNKGDKEAIRGKQEMPRGEKEAAKGKGTVTSERNSSKSEEDPVSGMEDSLKSERERVKEEKDSIKTEKDEDEKEKTKGEKEGNAHEKYSSVRENQAINLSDIPFPSDTPTTTTPNTPAVDPRTGEDHVMGGMFLSSQGSGAGIGVFMGLSSTSSTAIPFLEDTPSNTSECEIPGLSILASSSPSSHPLQRTSPGKDQSHRSWFAIGGHRRNQRNGQTDTHNSGSVRGSKEAEESQAEKMKEEPPEEPEDTSAPMEIEEETKEDNEGRRQVEVEEREARNRAVVEERLRNFIHVKENVFVGERKRSKRNKEVRRMVCDCSLTKEETARGEVGCGEDCLNRLLMIECGSRCSLGDRCMNKRFLNREYGDVEVFNAEEKGCGLRAHSDLPPGTFIMEYVGEVFDTREFKRRRKEYARDMRDHFYFMALKSDQLIDATRMGNISRFINHSCDPNAETQKWTVNGDLRIGFFSKKHIEAGEEINFDYRLERYGREPQRCYCGSAICRGWLGESPDEQTKEEKDEARRKEERDRRKREERRAFFEDIDLEDEIEKLNSHKLRNRQDTLNLSRLMVRAEDFNSRVMLLQLLQTGEPACRRLFLDYHGLKVLWSWMADLGLSHQHTALKVEILKTLEVLPITNKTQLTDSRVLSLVERWSNQGGYICSSTSSSSLSPPPPPPPKADEVSLPQPAPSLASESDPSKKSSDTSEESDSETEPKLPMEASSADDSSLDSEVDNPKAGTEEESSDSNDAKDATAISSSIPSSEDKLQGERLSDEEKEMQELLELHKTMVALAKKLLDAWKNLKEFFRIPKKERIELMKEHEREVDRGYKEYLDQASESDRDSERDRERRDKDRYSRRDHHYDRRRRSPERENKERYPRNRGGGREERPSDSPKMSKEQRRQLFELKVQQQEEEAKQRKMQEEMWTMHVDRCRLLGHDPYLTPIFDPTYQYFWDPVAANWQPYTGSDPNLPVPAAYGLSKGEGEGSPLTLMVAGAQGCRSHLGGAGDPPGLGQGGPDDPLNPANIPLPGEVPSLPAASPSQVAEGTPPHGAKLLSIPLPGEAAAGLEGAAALGVKAVDTPGAITIHLPPRWRLARDAADHVYFYHVKTRVSQWEPPTLLNSGLGSDSSSDSSSDSDSDSSSTSDSEDFSSEEEEEEEVETVARSEVADEKMIRRPRGTKRRRSEALVQERVISPIMEIDKEAARRERREAKERAREEARQERQEERITRNQKEEQSHPQQQQNQQQQQTHQQGDGGETAAVAAGVALGTGERDRDRERRSERHEGRAKREKSKERAATAIADNSDTARKIKDTFRSKMATFIVSVLNPYRRGDCREGKITCTEDFKYLARKLTHFVMVKELKQLHSIDALECSDSVKHKTRDFVRKYMSKYGSVFKRDPNDTKEY